MSYIAWVALGAALGALFVALARLVAPRRENLPLAAGLVVAALVYVGSSVAWMVDTLGWDVGGLVLELFGVAIFTLLAVAGLRISPWFLALGWAGHVLWDVALHPPEVFLPMSWWYPPLCIGFDLVVAGYVALRTARRGGGGASTGLGDP